MRIYIYDWDYTISNSITYYIGYGVKSNGERVCVINTSHMKCFYVGQNALDSFAKKRNTIVYDILPHNKCLCNITSVTLTLLRSGYGNYTHLYAICIQDYNVFKSFVREIKALGIRTYEDDIDPITEFLNKEDLHHTGWVDVLECHEVSHGILTSVPEYYCESGKIKASSYDGVPSMRVLSMDMETYSPEEFKVPLAHNPKDEIRLIGTALKDGDDVRKVSFLVSNVTVSIEGIEVYCYKTQYEMVEGYVKYVREVSPDIIIGFNHHTYDYAFLVDRYIFACPKQRSYSRMRGHNFKINHVTWSSASFKNNDFWMMNVPGVIDIDLMQYFTKEQGFKGHSLNEISNQVLGESKIDLDYNVMHHYFKDNDIDGIIDIIKYCVQDCELPIKLFEKNLIQVGILERAKVERISANHVYSLGSAARMIGQIHYQCKGTYVLDSCFERRHSYEGATVMSPKPGVYEHCATVDFSSLYPSIIISENICYTTYVPSEKRLPHESYNCITIGANDVFTFRKSPVGILPRLLKELIARRKDAKQKMKTSTYAHVWDKRQWAYKIVANSIYGLMGSSNPYLTFTIGAACVTSQGRQHLNQTRLLLSEQPGVRVIYGDTDSCFIQIDGLSDPASIETRCKELCKTVSLTMGNKVNLEYENAFKRLLLTAKKNYVAEKYDGKYYYRGGDIVRGNRCKFLRRILAEMIECAFSHGVDAAKRYIEDELDKFMNGQVPMEELKVGMLINEGVVSQQFKAMLKHMDDNGVMYKPNERIYYVYVQDYTVSGSHTSRRRDVRWVTGTNAIIDLKTYLNHELKRPILKITSALGISYVRNLS